MMSKYYCTDYLNAGTDLPGGSMPKFDPNAVNQIKANFLNPATMQLGTSGGGGGGFNPDQYNSVSFSFFNPSAMMTGKRRALCMYWHIVCRINGLKLSK